MHWKYKAHALALLSRVPGGRSLYHLLQRFGGTNRIHLDRDLGRAYELVDLIDQAGETIAGREVFEIGTGWRPFVPFVMALAGAKKVTTVDINPWLTKKYAVETWRALEDRLSEIAAHCRVPEDDVVGRYRAVPANPRKLRDLLEPLNIEYIHPGDARHTGLPDESVDLIVSSNVLEHIPEEIQEAIHRESLRILRPGGLSVHRFNPQDHYSTIDGTITHANFLRYSEQEWHWYGGTGLAYHNRLRSRQYRELFDRVGLETVVYRERVDQRSVAALRAGLLPVAECFHRFTIEELAVDYLWMACRKPAAVPSSVARPIAANVTSPVGSR